MKEERIKLEIIDGQIYEPIPPKPIADKYDSEVRDLVNVEIAREAMDSVGVDAALVFARQEYMDACVARYPDRFGCTLTFDFDAEDLEERVANFRSRPGMLAGRSIVGHSRSATLRPEFSEGRFERLYTYAEKYDLPLFFSTHGWANVLEPVAANHPGLTMIIVNLGLSQSPVSPPRSEPWDRLPGLLGLAKYSNVHVTLCGAPLLSDEPYPHNDVWPYLHRVINSFGVERVLWSSDFTRMRWLPVTGGPAPREQWRFYSDSLGYIRDTNELSEQDKQAILGGTIRRVLRWK